jgi:hypothetical protein
MASWDTAQQGQAVRLYEKYGRPLETAHRGEYVAIFPDGRTVLGSSVHQVVDRALDTVGPGSFIFKLGDVAVWKCR